MTVSLPCSSPMETIKILLNKGASNEGILDLVAEIIERYHNIQSKRIFQFLGEEVGLAVCHQAWRPRRRCSHPPLKLSLTKKKWSAITTEADGFSWIHTAQIWP